MTDRKHAIAHFFFDHSITTTKDRLLLEAICLFSIHGFEGTTTRMLAEAVGANNAAVHFHFGSKEQLYEAALTLVSARVHQYLLPFHHQLAEARANGPLSAQKAETFIDMAVDTALGLLNLPEFPIMHDLILCEQAYPTRGKQPISDTTFLEIEHFLIDLLQEYWNMPNPAHAALVSHIAVGGLVALVTHPEPVRKALGLAANQPLPAHAVEEIRQYSLFCLKSYHP